MIKGAGHRHVVLTTPKELWSFLRRDRYLLKVMADAGAKLIRDILKFYGPYLHLLVTEGGLGKDNRWYSLSYIDRYLLGRKWQYFLPKRLREYLPKNERTKRLIDKLFKEKRSFITYAKKEKKEK